MNSFKNVLLRLKECTKIPTDKGVAELLGLSATAFNERKKRDSFPEDKLLALVTKRPDLAINIEYVLTGKRNASEAFINSMNKFKEDDDGGDESRDNEPWNSNAPPTYRLSQDEWELMKRYRCAPLEVKYKVMQQLMTVDMTDKTTEDYKPEPLSTSTQNFHSTVTAENMAARDITINPGKKRK